jgi:hypothetical protein
MVRCKEINFYTLTSGLSGSGVNAVDVVHLDKGICDRVVCNESLYKVKMQDQYYIKKHINENIDNLSQFVTKRYYLISGGLRGGRPPPPHTHPCYGTLCRNYATKRAVMVGPLCRK